MLNCLFLCFLCAAATIIYREKCSLFHQNTVEVANELFKQYNDSFSRDVLGKLVNTTEIELIYTKWKSQHYNEDIDLNITQLLKKYGYPVEQHEVETSDGYLLNMFRIPNDGPIVFVVHGVLLSSDDFVTPGPDHGLAYILADAGYDVWLGNCRGNVHSRGHVSLSVACAEYWDFTWDDIGRYDLSAMIDYILSETKQEQLIYIGHSQGSTVYFVLCSERPEYNDKIKLMIALSAVSFISHTKSPLIQILSTIYPILSGAANLLGIYEFAPRNVLLDLVTDTFCGTPASAALICNNLVFISAGADYAQINYTSLPVIYGHYPAGTSTKQLVHYAQLVKSAKFRRFDYGLENLAKYGSVKPPDYPVQKITSPVAIFYSKNDWLTVMKDVSKLKSKLPNVVKFITVPYDKFTHFDFVYAKDVKELVYSDIIELIEEYYTN